MWRGEAQGEAAFWQMPALSRSWNTSFAIFNFSGLNLLNLERSGVEEVLIRWMAECVVSIFLLVAKSVENTSWKSSRTFWMGGGMDGFSLAYARKRGFISSLEMRRCPAMSTANL